MNIAEGASGSITEPRGGYIPCCTWRRIPCERWSIASPAFRKGDTLRFPIAEKYGDFATTSCSAQFFRTILAVADDLRDEPISIQQRGDFAQEDGGHPFDIQQGGVV